MSHAHNLLIEHDPERWQKRKTFQSEDRSSTRDANPAETRVRPARQQPRKSQIKQTATGREPMEQEQVMNNIE
jgi:hypothetical protein